MMLIFLTLVGAALLGLVVVVIYLNDRVNELERRTSPNGGGGGGGGDDGTWRGLSGKRLWDVMTGKSGGPALEPAALDSLRSSYEDVLSKHIESLFKAGQADARKGANAQPTSVKSLASPRGTVQSWIPLNHANALYRAGHDSVKDDIYETERVRMALDETTQILYAQTHLPLAQPFSDLLMPLPSSGDSSEDPAGGPEGFGSSAGPTAPQPASGAGAAPALPGGNAPPALGAAPSPASTASGGGMFAASAPAAPKPPGGA